MRGKEHLRQNLRYRDGITPAYAGKSYQCSMLVQHKQDHPRLCGEKEKPNSELVYPSGSPPPMRGKGKNV